MAENRRKPLIRFKGFTDDWEQRKLGNLFEEYSEKQHQELPPLTIIQGGGTILRDESSRMLQYDKASLLNYKMVNKGDFIVHLRSFEGGLEKSNHKGIISPAYHTFRGSNISSDFYYLYFRSRQFINNALKPHVYGIRDGRSIDIEGMKTIDIPYTSSKEQESIGEFISKINDIITLHQRKLDKLLNIKKSMLDKMFPKNGSKKPEIRFKGFTDDWEQRKLNTYLDVSYDVNDEGIYDKNDVLSVSGDFGVVNQIEFQGRSFAGASVLNYGVLQRGQVVYTKSPLKANPYGIIKANKGKTGIVSVLYGVYQPKENVDSNFIESYFSQNARLNNYLRPLVNKGAKNTLLISDEDAMLGEVVFPCVDEQVLISTLFERINNLITLHQRKLEKLKNLKKACLDKMFV